MRRKSFSFQSLNQLSGPPDRGSNPGIARNLSVRSGDLQDRRSVATVIGLPVVKIIRAEAPRWSIDEVNDRDDSCDA